jgi:hypothetical protein
MNAKHDKNLLNSEYFSRSTPSFVWKILFLAQIFYTASWDPIKSKLGTKKNLPNKISRVSALKFHSSKIFKVL